jgi:uncharacterized membrane protein
MNFLKKYRCRLIAGVLLLAVLLLIPLLVR